MVSLYILIAILSGLCLGCSAPGIGFWPAAWFCLAPLLFLISVDRSLPRSFFYGLLFGLSYNLVYLQWYLGLAPLDWLGFNAQQGQLLAVAALLINASHQAFLIALFSLLYCGCLRLGSLLESLVERWCQPLANRLLPITVVMQSLLPLIFIPLLWILVTNKLGNAHDLTGVPWSMLEYTQYKQLPLIQVADLIGGIGICFLIVMINTLWAQIAYVIFAERGVYLNRINNIKIAIGFNFPAISFCAFLLISILGYGYYNLSAIPNTHPQNTRGILEANSQGMQTISIVQPNINIEMEKTKKSYSVKELLDYQLKLSSLSPPGLCIWTEGGLPVSLSEQPDIQATLSNFAQSRALSLIVGTIDRDTDGNAYNAAWAVSAHGQISQQIYHKRYLVPFGEYTPAFVRNWPQWILALTNTPAGMGYSPGVEPALLNIDDKLIAPLICFEVISPELAAASVRAGGQLLVNINDLAWFHKSIIGDQMIACAVLRAVENRRDVIFAANTGPSAIISSFGQVKSFIGQNKAATLIGSFNYSSNLTLFTRCFVF